MKKGDFLSEKEYMEEEIKSIVKSDKPVKIGGFAKLLLTAISTAVLSTIFVFGGCGKNAEPTVSTPSPAPEIEEELPPVETPPTETPQEPVLIPKEQFEGFLENVKTNYSIVFTKNGEKTKYLIDGDKYQVFVGDDTKGTLVFEENDKFYKLTYDETERKWIKEETTDVIDTSALLYDILTNIELTNYDIETKVFTGTVGDETYLISIKNGKLMAETADMKAEIYDVEDTLVALPHTSQIIDKDAIALEQDLIWSKEKGYNHNLPLLTQTIEDWIKENDAMKWAGADGYELEKIVAMNVLADKLEFYGIISGYRTVLLPMKTRNALSSAFANNEFETKQDLIDFMDADGKCFNSNGAAVAEIEYSTLNYTAEQKAEWDIMSQNVLNRVVTQGIQLGSVNAEYQDAIPEFADAEILFGFKTPSVSRGAGGDLGNYYGWDLYYILKYDDKIELVGTYTASSVTNINYGENERTNVLNDNQKWYMLAEVKRIELSSENVQLYENSNAASLMSSQLENIDKNKDREY